ENPWLRENVWSRADKTVLDGNTHCRWESEYFRADCKKRREAPGTDFHERLLYCVNVNRTSLDHLLLGKYADVDRTCRMKIIITLRLLWPSREIYFHARWTVCALVVLHITARHSHR